MEEMTAPRSSVVDDPRHLRNLPDGRRGFDGPFYPLLHRRIASTIVAGALTPLLRQAILWNHRSWAALGKWPAAPRSTGVFLSALSTDGTCPPYSNTNPSGVER